MNVGDVPWWSYRDLPDENPLLEIWCLCLLWISQLKKDDTMIWGYNILRQIILHIDRYTCIFERLHFSAFSGKRALHPRCDYLWLRTSFHPTKRPSFFDILSRFAKGVFCEKSCLGGTGLKFLFQAKADILHTRKFEGCSCMLTVFMCI